MTSDQDAERTYQAEDFGTYGASTGCPNCPGVLTLGSSFSHGDELECWNCGETWVVTVTLERGGNDD